ncbi:hypothetical protein MKX01_036902 [Papaver californicum]|nr:hypothetical protein MKX01_036902 [Papaver californicum]
MEKDQSSSSATVFSFHSFCCILVVVSSSVSSISFLYWSQYYFTSSTSSSSFSLPLYDQNTPINLLSYTSAWNHLSFSPDPPKKLLKIALFVKKWPQRNLAGGLERHALTLHLALAKRGHELNIFTTTTTNNSSLNDTNTNMNFHFSRPTSGGYLDQAYRELGSNLLVLGPLKQSELAIFYNAIDVFVNPTLRAQGLDHTLLEATLSGKPVMATRFASITGSVIVGPEMGYTFSPTVSSLKDALLNVIGDGRKILEKEGEVARQRALKLFTATKMATAYKRLFLCISNSTSNEDGENYCRYKPPLQFSG